MSTNRYGKSRVACLFLCIVALAGCSSGGGDADPSAGTTGGTINTGSSTSSGGSTGSGSGGADTVAPTVNTISPADGATGVARNAVVTATFSEDIANVSVNNSTFQLSANGTTIDGQIKLSSTKILEFTPNTNLPYLSEVTATLTTGIMDAANNSLAADYAWKFITTTGSTPEKVALPTINGASVTGGANPPKIAMNMNGDAIVVWAQKDTDQGVQGVHSIFARRYNSTGWQAVELIEDSANNAINPQAAIDNSGNAIVIWQQLDGSVDPVFNITAKRFNSATSTWGTIAALDSATGDAINPQIAMNSSGVGMAVWQQLNNSNIDITTRRLAGADWNRTTTENIGNSSYAGVSLLEKDRQTRVAVNNNGEVMAIWRQYNGASISNDIVARHYNGTSWSPTSDILDNEDGDSANPQVAIDNNGNAIAIWDQFNPSSRSIFSTHYDGTAWSVASTIESSSLQAKNPQISLDNDGNAIAVWIQDKTNNNYSTVFANRYQSGNGWGTMPTALANRTEKGYANGQNIITGPQGQILVVWYQPDPNSGGADYIWATRYTENQGWNTNPVRLDDSGIYRAYSPAIGMDGDGNLVAAWSQYNSSNLIPNTWITRINQ